MLIYLAADHRGFKLKEFIKNYLKNSGYETVDLGNDHYDENDDYPDFASLACLAVSRDVENRRGILLCGSGVGVNIIANKIKGLRSVLAFNAEQAALSRKDDNTNILSLPADFLNEEQTKIIIDAWLKTPFSQEEKYQRRLDKISAFEKQNNI